MPLAERLALYGHGLRFDQLTKEAIHETKRRFIDSFATAVGAMDADAHAIARRCARSTTSYNCSNLGEILRPGSVRVKSLL